MLRYRFLIGYILFAVVIFAAGCRFPMITSPTGDRTIEVGDSISFEAAFYPDAIYKWTFSGGANDVYGQNPTVRFDRSGVYNVCLTVVFNDFESGFASLKVTVNDPSLDAYTITLNNYTATRDPVDSKALAWIVEKDGNVVLRRNAKGQSQFTYFDNNKGSYKIWLERFYNGGYFVASNKVQYSIP